jgi:hypothetical protein
MNVVARATTVAQASPLTAVRDVQIGLYCAGVGGGGFAQILAGRRVIRRLT